MLEFAYTDLDKLSEGRLTDISWEFVAFSFDEIPDQPSKLKVAFHSDPVGVRLDDVKDFQQRVRRGFHDFFYGAGWEEKRPEGFNAIKAWPPALEP